MQTKFDIGDFLLSTDGKIEKITNIAINEKSINYNRGCNLITSESYLTPEYLNDIEKYITRAQKIFQTMKEKLK